MYSKPLLLTVLLLIAGAAWSQVSVSTQHNDLLRTGWNNKEIKLQPSNVNSRQFGKVFKVTIDDQVYAQPLVAGNINISGGIHNVVYAATVNNTIYAIDGDCGTIYWSKNYTPATQRPPRNTDMTGADNGHYNDFSGNIGIVGTPVIDTVAQTMYFVARSTNGAGGFYQYLHAIDIKTGNERGGSPVLIAASVIGDSGDSNVGGEILFEPQKNNQRQALTLYNGRIYITYAAHGDWPPYHGWVLSYDAATLQQKAVYNVTSYGYWAGIWESGGGPAIDSAGYMYLVTGNGAVGYNGNLSDYINRAESALKLRISNDSIKVADFFTPKNYQALESADLDYGSMGAFLIPNSSLYFTGCKDGNLYLLNTANLGGYHATTNNVKQTIALGSNITLRCQPSYYRSSNKEFVYVWSENSQLKAFPVNRTAGNLDVANLITGSAQGPSGGNGAMLSTSSNNNTNGILWASHAYTGDANQQIRPGILRAFDANDVTKELWNSNQVAARDAVGNYAKFATPTIANGKVYLATFSNQLIAYGIIDSTVQYNCSTNLALNQPAVASSNEASSYLTPPWAVDGDINTRWSTDQLTNPQWVYVDLGQRDSICNITLQWAANLGKDFLLQVSDDTTNWTTISTITGNTTFSNSINVQAAGRYVRMYGTASGTGNGYALYEFQIYGAAIQSCTAPVGLTVNNIDTTNAVVRWSTNSIAVSYNVQYKPASASTWITINTTADTLKLSNLNCGNYYDYRVQSVCTGNSASEYSQPGSFNTLTCSHCGFLPTRFYTTDIGDVGIGGEACFTAPGKYVVKGSGKDISDTADAFRFVYKTSFRGNGKVQAQVFAQDLTNASNKAGVMLRESLDAGSRNVFMALTSGAGADFQYRINPGSTSAGVSKAGVKAPYFVRISKVGTIYKGYISPDNINWTLVSKVSIPNMGANGAPIYAGLAVTSHDNTKRSEVTFKQLKISFDSTALKTISTTAIVDDRVEKQANPALVLKVYPNPATDNFVVDFDVLKQQDIVVSIAGLGDGRIYYTESLTGFAGSYHKDNKTFKLRNGAYVVFVKTALGTSSKVLIKE